MASVDRLGPELILLAFAGIIVLTDLVVQRRWLVVGSSLLAVAGSLIWAGTLVARDMRGSAFDGVLTILGVIGILLTAGYILWMIQRVFLGERMPCWDGLGDATTWWERTAMVAMVAVIFLIGIYPAVVADVIETGVEPIVGRLA